MDEQCFYSCMKELLADDNNEFLSEFVALVRPEDSASAAALAYDRPSSKEDFPFNVERKRNKAAEYHHLSQPPPQPSKAANSGRHLLSASSRTALNHEEVGDLVKSAVDDKAKVARTPQKDISFFIYLSINLSVDFFP